MRATAFGLLLVLTSALAACKGQGYWIDRLNGNAFYQRANAVRRSGNCTKLVPFEFTRTLPVPARDGAAGRFEVLYYPARLAPSAFVVMTPTVRARFGRQPSDADQCAPFEAGPEKDLGPAMPRRLSMTRYYRAQVGLFESLDLVSSLYFAQAPVSPRDKQTLQEYAERFYSLAEPGLLPYYYRLNPDFWEWLRREAGRSIVKPA